jgi:hypothetical protein
MEFEEAMRRGERLFEGIAEANRLLLTAARVADRLPEVLRALGEASEADRVVVFEFRRDEGSATNLSTLRAEWVRDATLSLFDDPRLAAMPLDGADGGTGRRLISGESVESLVSELPPAERALFEGHGVQALLAFPILVSGEVWGNIGFDQCRRIRNWTAGERSALGTAAVNIGQAIERELALEALADSERRYEALLANLSEIVFQIDLEARWRFLNPTWEEITGNVAGQSLGRRFTDFVHPDDALAALEGFGSLVSGRENTVENELRFRHRSGRDLWFHVTARPQFDGAGRMIGVTGTLVDITSRRLAQAALGAVERRFAAVFTSSSDALLLVDAHSGMITECNPRAIEMFECVQASELVGASSDSLWRDPLPPEIVEEGRARINRGEAWTREVEHVTRRGRVFWGQMAMARMTADAVGTTLLRVTDINELKRSEERLRASLVEKEVLLKEVYHRVKNNLQIISALLRMQTRRVTDQHALEALEDSISRVMAMSMVHEKLYQAQNLVSIDFLAFAQSLVGFLNQLAIGTKASVSVEVSGASLALSIDQAIPLGLVLNELVTNSLKYAFPEGRGGRVSIWIQRDSPTAARVVVSDNGVGLPTEVDVERPEGIGFRIVRMLVEQMHGSIVMESGGGLRATVRVPVTPEHGAVVAP